MMKVYRLKIFKIFFLSLICLTVLPVKICAVEIGDVSGDGEISAYDAALTAQAAVDLINLTPEQTQVADVNGDSEVSAYDAALIAQYAVGLIDTFPRIDLNICGNGICNTDEDCSSCPADCGKCAGPVSLIYQDNFEDGNYNQIDPVLENGLSWQVVSGEAVVEKKIDNLSLGLRRRNTTVVSIPDINYTEFTLEAKLSITWSNPARIIVLYKDINNYYFFGITGSERGIVRVMDGVHTKIDNGAYDNLLTLPHLGASVGKFKVYARTDTDSIKFKVDKDGFENGIDYEMEAEDTEAAALAKFRNGKVGFQEVQSTENIGTWVYFDNISIYDGLKSDERIKPIQTYYVDAARGNDANPGAQALPWKTIQKAADTLMAGDIVLIAPGIYKEGMIKPKYSGAKGYPITYKALDSLNRPVLEGTVRLSAGEWQRYNENIYKATINWQPMALYLNNIPLFIAQEPNQVNPDDQMEREYFRDVPVSENDDTFPESHYQLVDSEFFTQSQDGFWNGATVLLYERDINAIDSREVIDYIAGEHKALLPYNPWVVIGNQDEYAIRNHLSILDKPGEYCIDKGKLKIESWRENADKTLDISVSKISGPGSATRIRFILLSATSGSEIYSNADAIKLGRNEALKTGETKTFKIDLTALTQNLIKVYATVDLTDAYEIYVWPYNGANIDDMELSKSDRPFDLGGSYNYHEYLIIDGLEIKHYQSTALDFSIGYGSNRNCIVRYCDIHHNMGSAISARSNCQGLIVEYSKLHHNYNNGVGFGGGSDYTVQYCDIYNNLDNGIWSGNGGPQLYYVSDVLIRGNKIHHQGSDRTHPDNIQLYRTNNAIVDGNYLEQEGHQNTWFSENGVIYFTNNIVVNGVTGVNSASESYLYNNLFYNSSVRYDAWQEDERWWTKHAEIRNNVFINSGLSRPPEHLWGNLFIDHNFYSVTGSQGSNWANFGYGEGSIVNPTPDDPASLNNYFVNPPTDFHLIPANKLIDAGFMEVPADKDYEGKRRFQGAKPDIGPYETDNPYSCQDCANGKQDPGEEGIDCGGICQQDFDGDGYPINTCGGIFDCDDTNPFINPGAEEVCDAIDNNCDGQQHPDYYKDTDNDGINNCVDNCPLDANPGQDDFDADGIGDVCDTVFTYFDDFQDRFTGSADLSESKKPNGLSWEMVRGTAAVVVSGGSKILRLPSTTANTPHLLVSKEGRNTWQNITLALDIRKAWTITNSGFVILYKDTDNFYYFDIREGALVKRQSGIDSIIGTDITLAIPHADNAMHHYVSEIIINGSQVTFKLKKDTMTGPLTFTDNSAHIITGSIGFIWETTSSTPTSLAVYADNIQVEVVR